MFDALEARGAGDRRGASGRERRSSQTFGGDLAPERDACSSSGGYVPVRHDFVMVRPTLDDLPDAPLPEGLEIRQVRPEHLPAIWAAHIEAHARRVGLHRAGRGATTSSSCTDPVTSDATLWRVAWDGDEVAGPGPQLHQCRGERAPRRRLRGYTEFISVRRPWRRRGLARALIAASFPLLRARGMTEATLGVDTENPSGALRVYERCGFAAVSRDTTYRKPLD